MDRDVEDSRIVVTVFGNVTKLNQSPISLAAVSIEVNDPYGSSVHIALLHSGSDGSYSDTFELERGRSKGNYTIYITASKVGFQDAQARLIFSIGITPFNISISPASVTVTQGETATFRIMLESKGEISPIVLIEVVDLPPSTSYSLSSNNETAPSTITLTVKTSEALSPGSYILTIVGKSSEGEGKASAEIIVKAANRLGYYAFLAIVAVAIASAIIIYKRKKPVTSAPEAFKDAPQYLEGLALSPSILLSLPDHLRKTAIIICNLKEASANDVAARSGRARAAESDYLNQLARMGIIKKKRKGRESYFYVE